MVRDEELKRLIKYAQGLNAVVQFKQATRHSSAAEWIINTDNTVVLVIYTWPKQSKTKLILLLVHELAHHLSHIYEKQKNNKILDIHTLENEFPEKLSKKKRKIIFESEKNDAAYRYNVWKETDIKLPKWKLDFDIDVDLWVYYYYYKNGKYPTDKEVKTYSTEQRKLYDPKIQKT